MAMNSSDTSPRQIGHGRSSHSSSKASPMSHPADLDHEPAAPTTIRAITARLRDRPGPVELASQDGPAHGDGAVPSPAPATSIPLEVLAKSSERRSSATIVLIDSLHNDVGRGVSTSRKCSENRRQVVDTRRLHDWPVGLAQSLDSPIADDECSSPFGPSAHALR